MPRLFFGLFTATFLLTSFTSCLFAQINKDTAIVAISEQDYKYESVVNVPSISKEILFKKAKQWALSSLKTVDQNIAFDETNMQINNAGTLTIDPKLNSAAFLITEGYFDFKIQLTFKDDRYKVKIDNIEIFTMMNTGYLKKTKTRSFKELDDNKEGRYIKGQINQKLTEMIRSLNESLINQNKEKEW